MKLEIKSTAPDFYLKNQDDIEISLKDLSGKWIVLYFYPKDNTPGCTTQAISFTEQNGMFEDLDSIILGVSPDSTQKHRNFIAKKDLGITLLSDEEKEAANAYGVWQLKKLYGREYMGIVRSTFIIDPDGKIAYIWSNVKVKGHADAVREKLIELKV